MLVELPHTILECPADTPREVQRLERSKHRPTTPLLLLCLVLVRDIGRTRGIELIMSLRGPRETERMREREEPRWEDTRRLIRGRFVPRKKSSSMTCALRAESTYSVIHRETRFGAF
jgi:hypothetical protein